MAKSSPKHFFSKLASVQTPRTKFDLGFVNTTTISTDYLYPVRCLDVLPGDTFSVDMSTFMRLLSPIDVPMMDNLHCDYHFWYVPMRLVWKHTKEFFGEKDRENPDIEYTIPQVRFSYKKTGDDKTNACTSLSIGDYFNYPIHDGILIGKDKDYSYTSSVMPFRCYNLIYDTWYRDEQRCDYSYYNVGEETDDYSKYHLLKRGKRFDYFTSSLLEPQIGENVTVPIGQYAPVIPFNPLQNGVSTLGPSDQDLVDNINNAYLGTASNKSQFVTKYAKFDESTGRYIPITKTQNYYYNLEVDNANTGNHVVGSGIGVHRNGLGDTSETFNIVPYNMVADLYNVSSSSIIQLRQAFQLQAYQEILAKSGTSYSEYIYGQFGVISPDARLQRPEFLGGCHFDLSCMPIVQNSSSTDNSKQGNLTAIISGGTAKSVFTRSFTEHGYIIILMNIYSDMTYYQGMPREYSRKTPLDFALPVFANLSDQEIKRKEILFTAGLNDNVPDFNTNNEDTFGFAERYAEYKYSQNTLTGLARPNAPLSVGYWTLAQQFDATLSNNEKFIESYTPIERIVSVVDQPNFIVNHKFDINCARCLPMYSDTMKWFMKG